MKADPPRVVEALPLVLGKEEVGRVVAVQVTELTAAELKRPLATSPDAVTPGQLVTSAVIVSLGTAVPGSYPDPLVKTTETQA